MKYTTYIGIFFLTLFSFIFLITPSVTEAQSTQLQVPIPVPNCSGLNEDGQIVTCNGNLVTAVNDFPALVMALFQFLIILMIVFLVGTIAIGGLMYLAAAGTPAKIDQAKTLIKNSALAILVLLFSVIIIQQVNPQLLDLSLTRTPTRIEGKKTCEEFPEDQCSGECFWDGNSCQNASRINCEGITQQNICDERNDQCIWVPPTSKCVTKRPETAGSCNFADVATSCATSTGCVWEHVGCNLKPENNSLVYELGFNPCTGNTNSSVCTANANCQWYSDGTCIATEVAYSRNCSSITEDICKEIVGCIWNDDNDACNTAPSEGAPCDDHDDCSISMFCSDKTYGTNDQLITFDEKQCNPRLPQNRKCSSSSWTAVWKSSRICQEGLTCGATTEAECR